MIVGIFLFDQPRELGGGYTFQADIFQEFLKISGESKHSFVILCNPKDKDIIQKKITALNVKVIGIRRRNFFERIFIQMERVSPLLRILSSQRMNWLEKISRKSGIQFMWFLSSGAFPLNIPYLTVVWDLMHRSESWFPEVSSAGRWDYREAFNSWFLQRATAIITGTLVGKGQIEQFYRVPSSRIKILPHPTPEFSFQSKKTGNTSIFRKYNLPDKYLFYPAQFWAHKNHANLILALKYLSEVYGLSLPIVFAGSDKGNQNFIRELAVSLGLSSQIHFLGFVPQDDLLDLYKNAIALTYVSFCGPENLPPLEAFAIGCPVIAARIAGSEEQLGDAALMVDPYEPASIASAIKSIFDDTELRNTLIARGYLRAKRWRGADYVRGVFNILDEFENIRRCWK